MPAINVCPPEIPSIDTDRLALRGHRLDDFADCAAMWADPEVVRHIGGRPFTAEEVWSRLLRYAGHWALLGFGYWTIRERESGRYLGEAGFADFRRDIDPPFGDAPEIGWALAPQVHGRGYATEAVRAITAWGDLHLGGQRTVCMIDPDNHGSIKVADKCGYRRFARTSYKGSPSLLFERSG
jgi:RimJ/RimL family protein N-acetyltransferase